MIATCATEEHAGMALLCVTAALAVCVSHGATRPGARSSSCRLLASAVRGGAVAATKFVAALSLPDPCLATLRQELNGVVRSLADAVHAEC